jgi:GR25 family glycosyltransferase involved in LPS biosynthesis
LNFQKTRLPNWTLTRSVAIDTAYIHDHCTPGRLRPSQKACFLSHRQVIGQSLEHDEPIYILEDDAVFGAGTCRTIELLLDSALAQKEWDIVFTDVGVDRTPDMVELLRRRSEIPEETLLHGMPTLLNLRSLPSFFGASAYLINAASKKKLYALLNDHRDLDIEYDIYLRGLILQSRVEGFCLFPFVTTVAREADVSQIQTGTTHIIENAFRRLLWRESGVDLAASTDQWPADDFALQEAIRMASGLVTRPDCEAMVQIAEASRPWRGVAARVLWDYFRALQVGDQVPPPEEGATAASQVR